MTPTDEPPDESTAPAAEEPTDEPAEALPAAPDPPDAPETQIGHWTEPDAWLNEPESADDEETRTWVAIRNAAIDGLRRLIAAETNAIERDRAANRLGIITTQLKHLAVLRRRLARAIAWSPAEDQELRTWFAIRTAAIDGLWVSIANESSAIERDRAANRLDMVATRVARITVLRRRLARAIAWSPANGEIPRKP